MEKESIAIGIDIGATKIYGVLAKKDGTVIASSCYPTVSEGSIDETLLNLRKCINDVYQVYNSKAEEYEIKGIGVALAGTSDRSGNILWSSNNPNLRGFNLKKYLEKFFNLPVTLENDSCSFAISEHFSLLMEGKEVESLIGIIWGSGIGTGIVMNNFLLRGYNGFGGKLGHIRSSTSDSAPHCRCGMKGCLETYISGIHVPIRYKEVFKKVYDTENNDTSLTSKDVIELYNKGDTIAKEVIENGLEKFALALSVMISIFSPEYVVFGGSMSLNSNLVEYLERRVRELIYTPIKSNVNFKISKNIVESGALGAALMVFDSAIK